MTTAATLARARRRPVLYMLVYGAFLFLIGITATGQAILTSNYGAVAVMNGVVAADRSIIGAFVEDNLAADDLAGERLSEGRASTLRAALEHVLRHSDFRNSSVLRVEVRTPEGTVLFGTDEARHGTVSEGADGFETALRGLPAIGFASAAEAADDFGPVSGSADVVEEYLPILADGEVHAVAAIMRDATPILAQLGDMRRDAILLTVVAAAVVGVLLFFIFRAAQRRISQQTTQLIEAARSDPLTGLLNHGTVVEALAEALRAAEPQKGRVSAALVDIDNFHLLNEVYGHRAGDVALQRLASLLAEQAPEPLVIGRFGPDEFLVVAPGWAAAPLEKVIGRLRAALAEMTLQFGASERLPITVSGGIGVYPEHADSATDLLSTITLTLAEAKSSGGDLVRVADRTADERADARGFDVLHGLVIAVDTKDRYTKRHSEDVARYATFLARRLGMDEEFQSTIRLAGLLHDIGKIGIPDSVLRKPGTLTTDENEIVKQHVALGDAIVRDLPNIEVIRAGIRHHHERWDGTGYLHGLTASEIPHIARILAVADVFSAMTTTRPYRKALSVAEALKRLGGAAGTQLDEELVRLFINGIETAPDAPLPGQEVPAGQLWMPRLVGA
jgi:diguanylate cyclase (GGDEF)-like protein/putative nucleotidyltransferase with HDIG domain